MINLTCKIIDDENLKIVKDIKSFIKFHSNHKTRDVSNAHVIRFLLIMFDKQTGNKDLLDYKRIYNNYLNEKKDKEDWKSKYQKLKAEMNIISNKELNNVKETSFLMKIKNLIKVNYQSESQSEVFNQIEYIIENDIKQKGK